MFGRKKKSKAVNVAEDVKKKEEDIKKLEEEIKTMVDKLQIKDGKIQKATPGEPSPVDENVLNKSMRQEPVQQPQYREPIQQPLQQPQPQYREPIEQPLRQPMEVQQPRPELQHFQYQEQRQHNPFVGMQQEPRFVDITLVVETVGSVVIPVEENQVRNFLSKIAEAIDNQSTLEVGNQFVNGRYIISYNI